ncbi:MAG TPA: hypothetical protein DGH68_04850 [Bacteroidetes bacterium]|nr:hypothetical protein [Bacteroidota bacterium]
MWISSYGTWLEWEEQIRKVLTGAGIRWNVTQVLREKQGSICREKTGSKPFESQGGSMEFNSCRQRLKCADRGLIWRLDLGIGNGIWQPQTRHR